MEDMTSKRDDKGEREEEECGRDRKPKSVKRALIECEQTLSNANEELKASLTGIVRDAKGLSEAVDARVENMRQKIGRNSTHCHQNESNLFSVKESMLRDRQKVTTIQRSLRTRQRSMEARNDEVSEKLEALVAAQNRAATVRGTIETIQNLYERTCVSLISFARSRV